MLHLASIILTVLVGRLCGAVDNDGVWEVVGTTAYPEKLTALVSEGLSNDGSNFIVSTKDMIFLTTLDLEVIISNMDAIPHELRVSKRYDHLGDCQYHNGLIYFPVEEPSYTNPAIFVYNVTDETIDFVRYNSLISQQHMPWIALDPASGSLYSSDYYNVSQLHIYDTDTLEHVKSIVIDYEINEVQGGAFYQGLLYLGVNSGDTIYAIDIQTGHVEVAIQQYIADDAEESGVDAEYEFEGLTFLDLTAMNRGVMHNTGNHQREPAMIHCDYF